MLFKYTVQSSTYDNLFIHALIIKKYFCDCENQSRSVIAYHRDYEVDAVTVLCITCKKGETLVPNRRIIRKLATQSIQPMHHPITIRFSSSSANSVQAGTNSIVKGMPSIPINISTCTGTNLWKVRLID